MNGLELAYKIHCCYLEPVIVYVTNHLEWAPEAFGVNALYLSSALHPMFMRTTEEHLLIKMLEKAIKSDIMKCRRDKKWI